MAISVESRYLVAGGDSPYLYVFDIKNSNIPTCYKLPSSCETIRDMRFIENSRLAILGGDNQIHFIDLANNNKIILTKKVKGKAIENFDVEVHGKHLITVVNTGEIYLYNLDKLLIDYKNSHAVQSDMCSSLKPCDSQENLQDSSRMTHKKSSETFTKSSKRSPLKDKIEHSSPTSELRDTIRFEKSGFRDSQLERSSVKSSITEKENLNKTVMPLYKSAKMDISKSLLNSNELFKFWKKFKTFPEKHRPLIWRTLLELPLNNEAFDNLISKGVHMAFHNLQKEYPLTSNKLLTKLQRILSCLAHYCSVFAEVKFLPELVFPFVKLFANDELICFETILSFFLQWGQHFLESHPYPPKDLIQSVENILKHYDQELYLHLKSMINIKNYIWLFLHNIYTDILSKQDWLSLMDFLMLNCHEPVYFLLFLVGYFDNIRSQLLKTNEIDSIEYFIKMQNCIDIKSIIQKMQECLHKTPISLFLTGFADNLPITGKQYPIFTFYPKCSAEEREKIKEQIFQEDQRKLAQIDQAKEIQRLQEEISIQENLLKSKTAAIIQLDKDRKEMRSYEEDLRLQQKINIEKDSRERRISQLKTLEESIRNTLFQQENIRTAGLKELEKDIQMRAKVDNYAIQSRLEEEAMLNLEFQTAQKMNEMIDTRTREEKIREMENHIEHQDRYGQLKNFSIQNNIDQEDEEYRLRADLLKGQKILEQNLEQEAENKKDLSYKLLMDEFEKNIRLQDIERDRRLRRLAEEEGFKDEYFMKLYKKHEQIIGDEEELQLRKIIDEERKAALAKAEERLDILEREKRYQKEENAEYREAQKSLDIDQKRSDFENQLLDLKRQNEQRQIEEERKLRRAILDIDEQRKAQREAQQDFLFKEREYQEKQILERFLMEDEKRILEEEKERLDELRNRSYHPREYQEGYFENEDTITTRTDNIISPQTRNYTNSYYSHDKRIDSFNASRSEGLKSQYFKDLEEVKIEDQERREEGQRTGTFQSPNRSERHYGQSVSSYTYSETIDDKSKRFNSETKRNLSPMMQAKDIISKHHQYGQSVDYPRQKYSMESTSRHNITSPDYYYGKRNYENDRTQGVSQRFYKEYSQVSKSPTLKSSPNLTYSSPGGSAQKHNWPYSQEDF